MSQSRVPSDVKRAHWETFAPPAASRRTLASRSRLTFRCARSLANSRHSRTHNRPQITSAGAFSYFVEFDSASGERTRSQPGYFVVDPVLSLPPRTSILDPSTHAVLPLGKGGVVQSSSPPITLPLDGLVIQTVIAKWMGTLSEWKPHLDLMRDRGYNMIHYTPLQQRGESNSPYSIYEQNEFSEDLFEGKKSRKEKESEMRSMLGRIKEEWGMLGMIDVVLNHTANNSKWLEEHPEAGQSGELVSRRLRTDSSARRLLGPLVPSPRRRARTRRRPPLALVQPLLPRPPNQAHLDLRPRRNHVARRAHPPPLSQALRVLRPRRRESQGLVPRGVGFSGGEEERCSPSSGKERPLSPLSRRPGTQVRAALSPRDMVATRTPLPRATRLARLDRLCRPTPQYPAWTIDGGPGGGRGWEDVGRLECRPVPRVRWRCQGDFGQHEEPCQVHEVGRAWAEEGRD